MKIDITPIIRTAIDSDRIVLDVREIDALFFFEFKDGHQHTVKWERHELENEFQPKRTVSEMKGIWEEGFQRRIDNITKALEIGEEPYRKDTHKQAVYCIYSKLRKFTGEEFELPAKMTKESRKEWTRELTRCKQLGTELTFVKIV